MLDRSKRYRGGIDGKTGSIDRESVELSIEQTETIENWLDGSSYLSRGIKKAHKFSIDRGGIELLSRIQKRGLLRKNNMR